MSVFLLSCSLCIFEGLFKVQLLLKSFLLVWLIVLSECPSVFYILYWGTLTFLLFFDHFSISIHFSCWAQYLKNSRFWINVEVSAKFTFNLLILCWALTLSVAGHITVNKIRHHCLYRIYIIVEEIHWITYTEYMII